MHCLKQLQPYTWATAEWSQHDQANSLIHGCRLQRMCQSQLSTPSCRTMRGRLMPAWPRGRPKYRTPCAALSMSPRSYASTFTTHTVGRSLRRHLQVGAAVLLPACISCLRPLACCQEAMLCTDHTQQAGYCAAVQVQLTVLPAAAFEACTLARFCSVFTTWACSCM